MDARTARGLLELERRRLWAIRDAVTDTTAGVPGTLLEGSEVDHLGPEGGSETLEREMQESLVNLAEVALDEVSDALDRVQQDTYGRCETCGQPIDDERLRALPTTRFCVRHASASPTYRVRTP
jgi:DnaK suppressor protein